MGWIESLLPASFNGVPFRVENTERAGGRRLAVHEYPYRDNPYPEDMGRRPRNFRITAYLVGELFIAERLLLETALDNSATVATLIHPTYGILKVWVGEVRSSESRAGGNYATIDMEFTLDGGRSSPLSITDTVSAVLAGLNSLVPYLEGAYIVSIGLGLLSSGVTALLGNQLSNGGVAFNAMPQATISNVSCDFAAAPADPMATASAVTGAFAAAAASVVAAQAGPPAGNDPVAGVVAAAAAGDPSGGLVALASFGAGLTPLPAAALPVLGLARAAVVTLIQGAALTAVITVYAQINWQSANQAEAARAQLQVLLDAQVEAAADAGNYDLFRAWRAISAQAIADMTARAQGLPRLASYSVAGVVPALALAQLLYQDATQADALAALNDVPHPIFMPANGMWLAAA